MLSVASDSSVFSSGPQLIQFNYSSVNLPFISASVDVSNFTNDYLQQVLQSMIQFKSITVYADSSNIINLVYMLLMEFTSKEEIKPYVMIYNENCVS